MRKIFWKQIQSINQNSKKLMFLHMPEFLLFVSFLLSSLLFLCFLLFVLLPFSVPANLGFLTLRLLTSYIYGAPILDVSRSHTTTQHSR